MKKKIYFVLIILASLAFLSSPIEIAAQDQGDHDLVVDDGLRLFDHQVVYILWFKVGDIMICEARGNNCYTATIYGCENCSD